MLLIYEVHRVINHRLVGRMHIFGNYGLIVTDLRTTGCAMYEKVPPPPLPTCTDIFFELMTPDLRVAEDEVFLQQRFI